MGLRIIYVVKIPKSWGSHRIDANNFLNINVFFTFKISTNWYHLVVDNTSPARVYPASQVHVPSDNYVRSIQRFHYIPDNSGFYNSFQCFSVYPAKGSPGKAKAGATVRYHYSLSAIKKSSYTDFLLLHRSGANRNRDTTPGLTDKHPHLLRSSGRGKCCPVSSIVNGHHAGVLYSSS